MEGRRNHMPILKDIPSEVLIDVLNEQTVAEAVHEFTEMERDDLEVEALTLLREKQYLTAAIEHLKERLTKKPQK